jgi:hypothetical protein
MVLTNLQFNVKRKESEVITLIYSSSLTFFHS